MGEFFVPHPGSTATARRDLAWDLERQLCGIPGFVPRGNPKGARLDSAGTAQTAVNTTYAVMAAASPAGPWAPLPAAVCAVGAATGDAAKRALTESKFEAR